MPIAVTQRKEPTMATKTEIKALLASKYGIKEDDILDDTPLSDIMGSDNKLGSYIKDQFDVELSTGELEGASNVDDLAKLLT
jgi:acyl carrier protein